MSAEFSVEKPNVSLLSAIESCCQYVTDLKLTMDSHFNSLSQKIDHIKTSYCDIVQKVDALERMTYNICDSQRHKCCDEVLIRLNSFETVLQSYSGASQPCDMKFVEDSLADDPSLSSPSPIVLVRNNKPAQVSASLCLDSSVQVITLNSESDFPDGSWLGDEGNPELRVRCPISPSNLLHVNTFCQTPEKMAVTLLDYLFPRDVLAVSNLSGKGKHGKKQLDPLMIYGIRCHLVYKFNIDKKDWYRIKQNMDSKCRTAWRKKVKGLPLGRVKTVDSGYGMTELQELVSEQGQTIILAEGSCMDDSADDSNTQVIHTSPGDIKVLHATPEQLVQLQEAAHIQVLSEDFVLPVLRDYPQMLVGGDEDDDEDCQSGQVLAIGCPEQSFNICKSEIKFDEESVDIESSEFIEVHDISMTS